MKTGNNQKQETKEEFLRRAKIYSHARNAIKESNALHIFDPKKKGKEREVIARK